MNDLAQSPMNHCSTGTISSPIGAIHFAVDGAGRLCAMCFHEPHILRQDVIRFHGAPAEWRNSVSRDLAEKIGRYFAGNVAVLDTIEIRSCGSPFERKVWGKLRSIPPGTTSSYGAIAEQVGQPGAARAVGRANGRNPIALVVPCHRVVGANGKLVGYGAGIDRKRWLLTHEAKFSELF